MKKLLLSIGLGLAATFASFSQTLTNVVFSSNEMVPGQKYSVTFDYTMDEAGFLRIVFGAAANGTTDNFLSWGANGAYGVNEWGSVIDLPAGGGTLTTEFTVPAGVPTTAEAQAAEGTTDVVIRATVRSQYTADEPAAKKNTWITVNMSPASASGKINSVIVPATGAIGTSIPVTLNYSHNFTTDQIVTVSLVTATIGGDLDWKKTAGYVENMTVPAGTDLSKPFDFVINATEAVKSSELAAGQEWRLYVSAFGKKFDKVITIEESAQVIDFMKITSIANKAGAVGYAPGDIVTINYEYSTTKDAVFEFSIVSFTDQFTVSATPTKATTELYVADILTSTTPAKKAGTVDLTILANAKLSGDLPSPEKYRVVAKLLHGDATTNVYKLETTTGINILITNGLVSSKSAATFTAFPNPVSGNNVTFSKELSNVVVYDFTGNVVANLASATEFNTSNLTSGIYMIASDQGTLKVSVK